MQLKLYSHGFFVYPLGDHKRKLVENFAMRFAQMEKNYDPRTGDSTEEIKAVFCAYNEARTEFGFLVRGFDEFKAYWEKVCPDSPLEIKACPPSPGVAIDVKMKDLFKPRGQQPEAIGYAVEDNHGDRTLEAATGFGKTISAFFALDHLKVRTAAVMSATHISTWTKCGGTYMGLKPGEVLVIKGSQSLRAVIEAAKQGVLFAKFMIFSAETIRNYIKEYESLEGNTFGVSPIDLWGLLGVGLVIRDECHEAIHATVRQTIYANVTRVIFLSATLVSDNNFINRVYDYIFGSVKERWKSNNNKHVCVRPLFHHMSHALLRKNFKFMGPKGYSHVKYEQSILKRKRQTAEFLGFINQTLRSSYINRDYQPGLKAVILCSTKEMVWTVQKFLQGEYPNLTVGAFCDGASTDELYKRDIVVSTPKGAGTGKDIPGLSVLIQTNAVNSVQLNLQIMGRLRPIELDGKKLNMDPLYIYVNNNQIRQHRTYHDKRLMDVRGKCKDIRLIRSNFILGNKI